MQKILFLLSLLLSNIVFIASQSKKKPQNNRINHKHVLSLMNQYFQKTYKGCSQISIDEICKKLLGKKQHPGCKEMIIQIIGRKINKDLKHPRNISDGDIVFGCRSGAIMCVRKLSINFKENLYILIPKFEYTQINTNTKKLC